MAMETALPRWGRSSKRQRCLSRPRRNLRAVPVAAHRSSPWTSPCSPAIEKIRRVPRPKSPARDHSTSACLARRRECLPRHTAFPYVLRLPLNPVRSRSPCTPIRHRSIAYHFPLRLYPWYTLYSTKKLLDPLTVGGAPRLTRWCSRIKYDKQDIHLGTVGWEPDPLGFCIHHISDLGLSSLPLLLLLLWLSRLSVPLHRALRCIQYLDYTLFGRHPTTDAPTYAVVPHTQPRVMSHSLNVPHTHSYWCVSLVHWCLTSIARPLANTTSSPTPPSPLRTDIHIIHPSPHIPTPFPTHHHTSPHIPHTFPTHPPHIPTV